MQFYRKVSFILFGEIAEKLVPLFPEVKTDLKKARLKYSAQEYLTVAIMTSFIIFQFEIPLLAFIFGFLFKTFLFGFITAFTVSFFLSIGFFFLFIYYPRMVANRRAKKIEEKLPFATIHLSAISKSKLPLHQSIKILTKFSEYEELNEELNSIVNDTEIFGLDIATALERAANRSPSKNLRELLWGILSTLRVGADISTYLREKSREFLNQYRRKLNEFSKNLSIYIEVYLTAIVLGMIFFVILTAIMAGIAGVSENIVILQTLIVIGVLPLISLIFIFLIKSTAPGGM